MKIFKKRKSKPKMSDPIFGDIEYRKPGYWIGEIEFEPTGRTIGIIITAAADGPTEEQRDFIIQLKNRYEIEVKGKAGNYLHETFSNWKEDFPREKIWDEFQLDFINMSNFSNDMIRLELSYSCKSDDHSFDVEFRNFEPQGISLNG
jgi:hypothetical protein